MNRRSTRVGIFEVCAHRMSHVALRKFIMQVLASHFHLLANRNADLTVSPLLWQVNGVCVGKGKNQMYFDFCIQAKT